ncbi:RecT-like DNA pairing protein [Gordonia phage Lilbeanie]|uniref:RecT-like DNA pairing protein n=1 Tax=Gordonia phage Lilbeanie TaxID=2794947 RepID=A0A7T1KSB2_9CAUD|nr:RecT-like ssDNA annealing protein [Gordonia phage Lilbeanie]QPO17131.1 RecT-like DNA pairing protein [Gordonia phage Lilbeanie]
MGRDLKARATAPARTDAPQGELTIAQKVDRMQREFDAAMPRGMEAVQLIRDAQTCLRMTPKLAECDHRTILGALMTCAQLGLRPGVLGQAYLLPMRNWKTRKMEAQLILGYQGLLELVHRSDRITMISARRVHEFDEFRLDYGLEEDTLVHRPPATGSRGRVVKWYAIARFKGGGYAITDPMTREEMEEHRDKYAMAKKDGKVVGPWATQFDEMADKTILRKLVKTLPKSPELVRAIEHDGAVRQDYTEAGIDSRPEHIDGEIIGDDDTPEVEGQPESEPEQPETVDPEPEAEAQTAAEADDLAALHVAVAEAYEGAGILDEAEVIKHMQNAVQDPGIERITDLTADEAGTVLAALAKSK